jgi:hypothetical protein
MSGKGTDGVMLARNQVRRVLKEKGRPDALACELARTITCCDEGLTVHDLFSPDEASQITTHCDLVCEVPPPRQAQHP